MNISCSTWSHLKEFSVREVCMVYCKIRKSKPHLTFAFPGLSMRARDGLDGQMWLIRFQKIVLPRFQKWDDNNASIEIGSCDRQRLACLASCELSIFF